MFRKPAKAASAVKILVCRRGGVKALQRKHPWLVGVKLGKLEMEQMFPVKTGQGYLLVASAPDGAPSGDFESFPFANLCRWAGRVFDTASRFGNENWHIDFADIEDDAIEGFLSGLGLAEYRFRDKMRKSVQWHVPESAEAQLASAKKRCASVNFARHLTNYGASTLNPKSYEEVLQETFSKYKDASFRVWKGAALEKEKLHLLKNVGQGADEGARLVRVSWRPKGTAPKQRPIAIVGKGITFDTGGLDIKPSAGMRQMKKDMAGSAAVAGLAHWVCEAKLAYPIDFYFAIAENAVGPGAYKPGDIIETRAGITVEIDNTDAEGRLVMADALTMATDDKKNMPEFVVDIATLTGAMRVALGTEIGGYFSTDERLSKMVMRSGDESGDYMWPMPLVQSYSDLLRSDVADLCNSAASRFGGGITAALFLKRFIRCETPWLHFDIMGAAVNSYGPYRERGANGQGVMALMGLLTRYIKKQAEGPRDEDG